MFKLFGNLLAEFGKSFGNLFTFRSSYQYDFSKSNEQYLVEDLSNIGSDFSKICDYTKNNISLSSKSEVIHYNKIATNKTIYNKELYDFILHNNPSGLEIKRIEWIIDNISYNYFSCSNNFRDAFIEIQIKVK